MRTSRVLAIAALGLAPAGIAATRAAEPLALQPPSRIWVQGTSNVRDFTCTSTAFETRVESPVAGTAAAVLAGTKAVQGAALTVPASSLDCRNGVMNAHMLEAVKAQEAPTITFRLASYDLASAQSGVDGTALGALTIGGVTHTVRVTAHAAPAADGALRLTGSYALRLTDYGLTPPSLMMGTMTVGNVVTVNYDLLLRGEVPKL